MNRARLTLAACMLVGMGCGWAQEHPAKLTPGIGFDHAEPDVDGVYQSKPDELTIVGEGMCSRFIKFGDTTKAVKDLFPTECPQYVKPIVNDGDLKICTGDCPTTITLPGDELAAALLSHCRIERYRDDFKTPASFGAPKKGWFVAGDLRIVCGKMGSSGVEAPDKPNR